MKATINLYLLLLYLTSYILAEALHIVVIKVQFTLNSYMTAHGKYCHRAKY